MLSVLFLPKRFRHKRPLTIIRLGFWTGLVLSLAAPGGAWAFDIPRIPFAPRTYVCPRAEGPVTIDGRPDESAWDAATPTAEFLDIEGSGKPAPEFSTSVRMLYDDLNFYIAARMEEPHVWATLTERDAVIYHDNDFEVFIDPDGDNHQYYELEINALGTVWDLFLVRPYRDGGPAVNAWDIQGLQAAVWVDGTLNDPGDQDRGWSVEIAIPWDVLAQAAGRPAPPEPGDIWRVNFSRVQWQVRASNGGYEKVFDPDSGKPLPEDNWVWSPQGLVAMHYPEMWGEVLFAGPEIPAFDAAPEHESITAAALLMPIYYRQKQWFEDRGRFAESLAELDLPRSDLPPNWDFSLETCRSGFTATLATPHGIATVDQFGRLERTP